MRVSELVGDNIRVLRRAAGLTQAELAEAMAEIGFRWVRQTVAETEAGRRDAKVEELVAIAAYFDMPLSAILGTPGGQPNREESTDGVDVGGQTLSFLDWVRLAMTTRHVDEKASKGERDAIDSLVGSSDRPWARQWRRAGGHPAQHFIQARDEQLRRRTRLPGPIFVWEGDGPLETATSVRPWGAEVRVKLEHGIPYVARDESEGERLLETTKTHPELRVIDRQEAYRLRQKRGG